MARIALSSFTTSVIWAKKSILAKKRKKNEADMPLTNFGVTFPRIPVDIWTSHSRILKTIKRAFWRFPITDFYCITFAVRFSTDLQIQIVRKWLRSKINKLWNDLKVRFDIRLCNKDHLSHILPNHGIDKCSHYNIVAQHLRNCRIHSHNLLDFEQCHRHKSMRKRFFVNEMGQVILTWFPQWFETVSRAQDKLETFSKFFQLCSEQLDQVLNPELCFANEIDMMCWFVLQPFPTLSCDIPITWPTCTQIYIRHI